MVVPTQSTQVPQPPSSTDLGPSLTPFFFSTLERESSEVLLHRLCWGESSSVPDSLRHVGRVVFGVRRPLPVLRDEGQTLPVLGHCLRSLFLFEERENPR